MRTKKIGVLALQGSVEEHLHTLSQIEAAEGFPIRTKEELSRAEAIILPGGESTTLRKLLREFDLEVITKEGFSTTTPIIVTNTDAYVDVVPALFGRVKPGDMLLKILR